MSWTIELTGLLLTAALTGNAGFLIWYLISGLLGTGGYGKWFRAGLWGVGMLYLLPFVYGWMVWRREEGGWGGVLFWPTQTILNVVNGVLIVWAIGAGILYCRLIFSLAVRHKSSRAQIPCEMEMQGMFDEVCRKMGVKPGKVALVWDYCAEVPEFTGILHPRVVLPVQGFTEQQLRIIFLHELMHYKQRDIYLLALSVTVQIFQWFHPGAWIFGKTVRKYSEFACDEGVCRRAGGRKVYFDTIFEVMCTSNIQRNTFSMHMMEDKNELIRRKKHMKIVETKKTKPLACAAALSIALAVCGSVTVAAAADGIGRQYQKWYQDTLVEVEEPYEPVEYEEFTDHGPAEGIREEIGETEQVTRSMKTLTWNVGSRTTKKTAGFSASKGQTVSISVWISPTTKSIKAGIVDSSGNRRYVTGKESISHSFEIKKTGTYRVFVENTNASAVDVEGSYTVR